MLPLELPAASPPRSSPLASCCCSCRCALLLPPPPPAPASSLTPRMASGELLPWVSKLCATGHPAGTPVKQNSVVRARWPVYTSTNAYSNANPGLLQPERSWISERHRHPSSARDDMGRGVWLHPTRPGAQDHVEELASLARAQHHGRRVWRQLGLDEVERRATVHHMPGQATVVGPSPE